MFFFIFSCFLVVLIPLKSTFFNRNLIIYTRLVGIYVYSCIVVFERYGVLHYTLSPVVTVLRRFGQVVDIVS